MNNKKHLSEVKRLIHIYETCNDSSLAKNYAVHLMRHHARYFVEQAERVQELEARDEGRELAHKLVVHYAKEAEQQNKRYREFIKTISDPWEVARKIVKGTNKKGASAEEIVAWIEREAERILEGEE